MEIGGLLKKKNPEPIRGRFPLPLRFATALRYFRQPAVTFPVVDACLCWQCHSPKVVEKNMQQVPNKKKEKRFITSFGHIASATCIAYRVPQGLI